MGTTSLTFCYNPDKYPLLHEWLNSLKKQERSQNIREALTRSIQGDSNTLLVQILEEVQAIRSQGVRPVKVLGDGDDPTIPPDILANLQSMGE